MQQIFVTALTPQRNIIILQIELLAQTLFSKSKNFVPLLFTPNNKNYIDFSTKSLYLSQTVSSWKFESSKTTEGCKSH